MRGTFVPRFAKGMRRSVPWPTGSKSRRRWRSQGSGRAEPGPVRAEERGSAWERLDLILEPGGLAEADRVATQDRLDAIREARNSGLPLFRSFDSREVLRETLATLAGHGVDVGPSAIVNFDSLEVWVPAEAKRELAALSFVRHVRKPVAPVSAGIWESEGVELTGADLAHAAASPITGTGISVAIIDTDYQVLGDTMASLDDEPYAIPVTNMWKQKSSGSDVFENVRVQLKLDQRGL